MTIRKLVLILVFMFFAIIVLAPLFAQACFDKGRFEMAAKLDAFNAGYAAGYGYNLFKNSLESKDKVRLLNEAEVLFKKAVELNPVDAEYYMMLGQVQTGLCVEDKKDAQSAVLAIGSFRKAVEKDPNGFYISYAAGYAGLSLWKYINDSDRAFVMDRLRYCLKVQPSFVRYIYSKFWQETANPDLLEKMMPDKDKENRLRYLKEIRDNESEYTKASSKISTKNWSGVSSDGHNEYRDGAMFWSGTMSSAILMPPGKSVICIRAKGSSADGVFPYMAIELDGKMVGESYVNSVDWAFYRFKVTTDGGGKILSITFLNDDANCATGEDRNLYIGEAEVK